MSSHLVTGDLLILSGSSVTLKKKTNVSVRNQSTNRHTHTPPPAPVPCLGATIIHQSQHSTSSSHRWIIITNLNSLHWNTGWMWDNKTPKSPTNNWEGQTNAGEGKLEQISQTLRCVCVTAVAGYDKKCRRKAQIIEFKRKKNTWSHEKSFVWRLRSALWENITTFL